MTPDQIQAQLTQFTSALEQAEESIKEVRAGITRLLGKVEESHLVQIDQDPVSKVWSWRPYHQWGLPPSSYDPEVDALSRNLLSSVEYDLLALQEKISNRVRDNKPPRPSAESLRDYTLPGDLDQDTINHPDVDVQTLDQAYESLVDQESTNIETDHPESND